MFLAVALAVCLQAKPHFTLKQIWTGGPNVDVDGDTYTFSPDGYWTSPTVYRYLAAKLPFTGFREQPHCVIEHDTKTDEFRIVSTEMDADGLPADWSKYYQLGRYAKYIDPTTHIETFVDLGDLTPKYQLKQILTGGEAPIDQAALAKAVILPTFLQLKDLGDCLIMWDSADTRIMENNFGAISCKPGTWEKEDTLVPEGKLRSRQDIRTGASIVGNPDTGPFVIQNEMNPTASYYFDADWNSLKVDPTITCYNAGTRGFLVKGTERKAGQFLETLRCLDPKTGQVLWTRDDLGTMPTYPQWVGDHVVAITLKDLNSGISHYKLNILDSASGETVGDIDVPQAMSIDYMVRDDTLIFHDDGRHFFAYKIVAG